MKPLLNRHKLLTQLIEYLISGGVYFWIGYASFALLWSVLDWSLWWSAVTSNLIGWIVNYLMQRYWVFDNSGLNSAQAKVTARYIFITAIDFVMNYYILYGLQKAGITPYIGQFVSAAFFTAWNYFWYRFWVFPVRLPAPRHPGVRRRYG